MSVEVWIVAAETPEYSADIKEADFLQLERSAAFSGVTKMLAALRG